MPCGSSPAAGLRWSSMRLTRHCCGPAARTCRSTWTGEASTCATPRARRSRSAATEAAISGSWSRRCCCGGRDDLPRRRCHRHRPRDPGSPAGAVAYVVDGQNDVFVGDSVEMHGAASGFPGYDDPDAYRASLISLRDEVGPSTCSSGTPIATRTARPTASSSTASRRVRRWGEHQQRGPHPQRGAGVPGRWPAGVRLSLLALRPGRRGTGLHGRPHPGAVALLHHDARLPHAAFDADR